MSKNLQSVRRPTTPPAALRERASPLPTQHVAAEPSPAAKREEEPAEDKVHLTIYMRESIHDALKLKAVQEKTTVQAIMLRALKTEGLAIEDHDLIDGRRRKRGKGKR